MLEGCLIMGIFKTFPTLETERLILRKLTYEDAPSLFDILSDDRVTEHMDAYSQTDVSESLELIDELNKYMNIST
jgi:[ribosomal protein S5]-alanine N-acetyltransferase